VRAAASPGDGRILSAQFVRLWVGGFAVFLSFFLLLPTLPLYARAVGVAESRIGVLTGAFPLAAMVLRPVAGWAGDRYGRRPLMLLGALVFAISSLLYVASRSLPALVAVRALHGVGMALYPTGGMAMAADLAPPARRGHVLGLVGIAANVALAVGPVAGIWLAEVWGFAWLFVASAAVALLAGALALGQWETLATRLVVPLSLDSAFSRAALYPCAIMLGLMITYGVLATYLPLYAAARGHQVGAFFTLMAVALILSRGVAGGLSDRVGRPPVAAAGTASAATALVVITLGDGPWPLVAAGLLYGLGLGAAQPALVAWCVDHADMTERGKAMGTFYTALELGIAAGAIGAGWVLGVTSYSALFLVSAGVAGAASALALARTARLRSLR
jgi:MFS family permease